MTSPDDMTQSETPWHAGARESDEIQRLRSGAEPEEARRAWARTAFRRLSVQSGVLVLGAADSGPFAPVETQPAVGAATSRVLAAAAESITRREVFVEPETPPGTAPLHKSVVVACPIILDGRLHGAVAVEIATAAGLAVKSVLEELQWGMGLLDGLLRGDALDEERGRGGRLETVLHLIATTLEQRRFHGAATAFCTEVATRLGCERVSLGIKVKGRIELRAISHSARFDRKTNAMREIESVMEEALDRQTTLVHPAPEGSPPLGLRAHEALLESNGDGALCSVPIAWDDEICGILTVEKKSEETFELPEIEEAEIAAEMAGAVLELRRRQERSWLVLTADSLKRWLRDLVGPHHVALKLVTFACFFGIAFLALARGDYRVSGESVIEAAEIRAAVAPFHGFVLEAPRRAGDQVEEGDRLALLDDRELVLQRLKWSSQYEQSMKQARDALAKQDAAQVEILSASASQAKAELDLVQDRLARVEITAPFGGTVVSGDLTQRLGAPVEQGDVLFEIAPAGHHRVAIQVDEREVDEVAPGQRGELMLAGLPGDEIPIEIVRVTPVASVHEGLNRFRVEAVLLAEDPRVRPGLEGVTKVEVGRRQLLWIWTHEAVDWVRLKLWSWLP